MLPVYGIADNPYVCDISTATQCRAMYKIIKGPAGLGLPLQNIIRSVLVVGGI